MTERYTISTMDRSESIDVGTDKDSITIIIEGKSITGDIHLAIWLYDQIQPLLNYVASKGSTDIGLLRRANFITFV